MTFTAIWPSLGHTTTLCPIATISPSPGEGRGQSCWQGLWGPLGLDPDPGASSDLTACKWQSHVPQPGSPHFLPILHGAARIILQKPTLTSSGLCFQVSRDSVQR